ncbi:hypothetical protein Glove_199g146 [Diversispora epigaea]|uniref:Cytochrome P450 n=1 Tax=Diversispora epigaea TaxID=1348612 RepID=A0A397ITQ7_9GLOM|nr:hypothetical protein Glove_199g146 [Diversispora epigaea]
MEWSTTFFPLSKMLTWLNTLNFSYEILKILLIASIAYTSHYYYKYFTRENPLPGPFPLPFIGNILQVFRNFSFDLENVQAKYGDLCEFHMGSKRFILLGNNDLIEKIMKQVISNPFHNRVSDDSEGLKEIGVLNTGLLFNNNYDDWKLHRKIFVKVLLLPSFVRQSIKFVQDNFLEMEQYWEKLGEDEVLEFDRWMKYYFFDTIFIVTTSKPAYSLANYYNNVTPNEKSNIPESILKECNGFVEAVSSFAHGILYFHSIPRAIRNFPGVRRYTRNLKERIDWFRNNVENIVKSKREEISKTPIDQKLKPDMLTMLMTVNTERDVTEKIADDENDEPISDKNIAASFMEAMLGGIDTGSNSICFLVYYLENNPRVKQRMIEEIEYVLGKDPNKSFTFEDLSKLKYVKAVIKEASRVLTVSPIRTKRNSAPEVIGGYKWSKGTDFLLNMDRIQNHKSYWKDPDVFNPDRFMDKENPDFKNRLYMFGGTMRKCPGRNFGMMELKATLVMLYRKYDIELMGKLKQHIGASRTCDELKVKLRKRKNL